MNESLMSGFYFLLLITGHQYLDGFDDIKTVAHSDSSHCCRFSSLQYWRLRLHVVCVPQGQRQDWGGNQHHLQPSDQQCRPGNSREVHYGRWCFGQGNFMCLNLLCVEIIINLWWDLRKPVGKFSMAQTSNFVDSTFSSLYTFSWHLKTETPPVVGQK